MKRTYRFYLQLAFTLLVCAFLIVPVVMSVMAGITENFFQGISSGVTIRWITEVWRLYADTIFLSLLIALACLVCTIVLGVPAAYVLSKRQGTAARMIEELLTLPLAIPGLAIALALIITYGGFRDFRSSWMFILVGSTHSASTADWSELARLEKSAHRLLAMRLTTTSNERLKAVSGKWCEAGMSFDIRSAATAP